MGKQARAKKAAVEEALSAAPVGIENKTVAPPPAKALADSIDAAGLLLAYAAEHGKDIDKTQIDTIVRAGRLQAANQPFSESDESGFWDAYRHLCAATQPVSRESLRATAPLQDLSGRYNDSLARRTVSRYQLLTVASLFILLLFQIYWVLLSTLVIDIGKLQNKVTQIEETADLKIAELSNRIPQIGEQIEEAGELEAAERIKLIEKERLEGEIEQLVEARYNDGLALEHQMRQNFDLLRSVNLFFSFLDVAEDKEDVVHGENVGIILVTTGSISLEVMSLYVLPILYGLLGACAYVLRTVSHQITERTFTGASTIRLQLRIFLGALAGLSVAWFSKSEDGSGLLSSIAPLALAFLAGYSVELVFSAMDALIGAFSREKT